MTKDSSPILSFCIPTYNNRNELELTLESMIPQILEMEDQIEIVISDNCSEDNTQGLVEKYMALYSFITYNKNSENIGPGRNMFKAIELASGDLVWLMGDDELMPGALQHVLDAIVKVGKPYPSNTYVNWIHRWPKSYQGNRAKWETQTNARVKEDILVNDIESYFKFRAPYFAFMSAHILDRSLIDLDILRSFADTRWPQVAILIMNLNKNPKSLHIAKPCVLDIYENYEKPRAMSRDPMSRDVFEQLFYVLHDLVEMGEIKEAIARQAVLECYGYIFCDHTDLWSILDFKLKGSFQGDLEHSAHRLMYVATLANISPIRSLIIKTIPIILLRLVQKIRLGKVLRRILLR